MSNLMKSAKTHYLDCNAKGCDFKPVEIDPVTIVNGRVTAGRVKGKLLVETPEAGSVYAQAARMMEKPLPRNKKGRY